MSIEIFLGDDEIDNLINGLCLVESALRGLISLAEHSVVDPEDDLQPIFELVQGLSRHAGRLKKAVGFVEFDSPREPEVPAHENGNGGQRKDSGSQSEVIEKEPRCAQVNAPAPV